MAKIKAANPRVAVKIRLDPDIYTELRLHLFNPDYVYGFKHGAMSELINTILREAFKRKAPQPLEEKQS